MKKMVKNKKVNLVNDYYLKLKHFRSFQHNEKDMNKIFQVLDNGNLDVQLKLLKKMVLKYKHALNEVGKQLTGIVIIKDSSLYEQKSSDDIYLELIYISRVIVLQSAVSIGLEKSLKEICNKIKSENINLFSLDMY